MQKLIYLQINEEVFQLQINSGSATTINYNETEIIVAHHGNQYFAYKNLCPHNHRMLFKTTASISPSGLIFCEHHYANFCIETGICESGPCLGKNLAPYELLIKQTDNSVTINLVDLPS